jgi:hypothetical protein
MHYDGYAVQAAGVDAAVLERAVVHVQALHSGACASWAGSFPQGAPSTSTMASRMTPHHRRTLNCLRVRFRKPISVACQAAIISSTMIWARSPR